LVAGFPLQSLLASGPQVSTGIVTALAGIRDDASRIQISAPIQPGNSGGPVLDREGRVLGVAASTLGTLATTIATGTVPQNVNFAIRADRVASLLRRLDIRVDSASPASPMTNEEVAARALTSVVLVECLK
jgi:S1-C subfamily serine protease